VIISSKVPFLTFSSSHPALEYTDELTHLRPIAKIKLDTVSLVVKYSHEYPNLLITPDGGGQIYIANCLRPFDYQLPAPPQVAEIEPESNLSRINSIYSIFFRKIPYS